MEEEDKDAFQEEERAGESFLQPSSKSRFARSGALTIYTFHLFPPFSQSQISQFCFFGRFTLRKRKRRPAGMGASEDTSDSVSVCRSVSLKCSNS